MPPDEDWEWTFSHVHPLAAEDLFAVVELFRESSPKQRPYLRKCAREVIEYYPLWDTIFNHDYPWQYRLEEFCNAYFSRKT